MLTALAALGGIGVVAIGSVAVWVARQGEARGSPLLVAVVLLVPVLLVLGLQTGSAVLLRRPSARTWALGVARR